MWQHHPAFPPSADGASPQPQGGSPAAGAGSPVPAHPQVQAGAVQAAPVQQQQQHQAQGLVAEAPQLSRISEDSRQEKNSPQTIKLSPFGTKEKSPPLKLEQPLTKQQQQQQKQETPPSDEDQHKEQRQKETSEEQLAQAAVQPKGVVVEANGIAGDEEAEEEEEEEEEEGEMEAVAGRLEIRVVDRAGGSAVVETANSRAGTGAGAGSGTRLQPLARKLSPTSNGSPGGGGDASPASPGVGQEDPSVYFDAADENVQAANGEHPSPVPPVVTNGETRDKLERRHSVCSASAVETKSTEDRSRKPALAQAPAATPAAPGVKSKIPVPVKSPRCSFIEPDSNRSSEEHEEVGAAIPLRRCQTLPDARPSDEDSSDARLAACTPALRRRREREAKYVTDQSQLNLRFRRPGQRGQQQQQQQQRQRMSAPASSCQLRGIPSHLLAAPPGAGGGEESSEADSDLSGGVAGGPVPPPHPPPLGSPADLRLVAENNARCRRFHPVASDGSARES